MHHAKVVFVGELLEIREDVPSKTESHPLQDALRFRVESYWKGGKAGKRSFMWADLTAIITLRWEPSIWSTQKANSDRRPALERGRSRTLRRTYENWVVDAR
jgi:hypothetical protein